MKIAVVNPPFLSGRFSRTSRSPAIGKSGTLYWPFWLAYAVGSLEESGHDVLFLDCPAEDLDEAELSERIREFDPSLIVLDTSTPSIQSDLLIASDLAGSRDNATVLLVGTHASALPEACLEAAGNIDGVAVSEYDHTLVDVARCLEEGSGLTGVRGLVLGIDGEIVRTGAREPITELASLPFLADVYRRHLNPENYFFAAARSPSVMNITSRG